MLKPEPRTITVSRHTTIRSLDGYNNNIEQDIIRKLIPFSDKTIRASLVNMENPRAKAMGEWELKRRKQIRAAIRHFRSQYLPRA